MQPGEKSFDYDGSHLQLPKIRTSPRKASSFMPPSNLGPSGTNSSQMHVAHETLPVSTSPFEPVAQTRYDSMQPSSMDVQRYDSGYNLKRRTTRRMSHDIEAQKRGSSFAAAVSAGSLGGLPSEMPIHKPLEHSWNFVALILLLVNLGATGFYFYIRVTGLKWAAEGLWEIYTPTTANMIRFGYSIFILAVEALGVSALLPYALLLTRSILPKRNGTGLPSAATARPGCVLYPFHLRVLVPCYKEDLNVISTTVRAAMEADMPPGAHRTVYLCDDGNDPVKRAWASTMGEECVYVTGRVRQKGEANGKSSNLNNCLKNVIYAHTRSQDGKLLDWTQLSNNEVVVVLDSDMVPKPDFFLKVLEVMTDPNIAFCQTPQAFHNISQGQDIFNNINLQFWE